MSAVGLQGGCGLLVAAAAAGVTVLVSGHNVVRVAAILIVVAGTLWFATTARPVLALAVLMLYLGLLDGYLKLATGSQYTTFIRDVLLFSLALGQLLRMVVHHRPMRLPPLGVWALMFTVILLANLANPHDGTLYHSLGGLRQHLEFVPLFFLTYAFVRTKRALRIFVLLMLLIAVVNGAVSWVQFHETPAQLAAWGPGYSQRVLGTGQFGTSGRNFHVGTQEYTRPFGLGSDSGDGGIMGAFAVGALLAALSLSRSPPRLMLTALVAAGVVIAVYTSQGRAAIVASLVVALGYGLLAATGRARITMLLSTALVVIVAYAVITAINNSGTAVVRYQGLSANQLLSTTSRARGFSYQQIPQTLVRYPFGDGLGVAGPAAAVVSGAPKDAATIDSENEILFAVEEAGIPGLIALVGLPVTILVLAVRRIRREPDRETRVFLAAILAPVAGILALYFASALTPKAPAGPYLWASAGIAAYWLVKRPRELVGGKESVLVD